VLSRVVYRKQRGRRLLTALATLSLVTATFLAAGTVLAVNPSSQGLFELDTSTTVPPCPVTNPATTICGNANTVDSPAGGADDWANVYKSATGLGTASADHAFARTFITDPTGSAENSFYTGGGSKDVNDIPQWQYGTTNDPVPDKDDIENLFAAAYTDTVSSHTILYFGMDRFDNNGDSETGFWFFENPVSLDGSGHFTGVHTGTVAAPGDVLVLADWGGSNPVGDITVYQWIGGKNPLVQVADNATGDCALAGASSNFCAVVNRTADTPQWPFLDKGGSAVIRPLELFEAGIDLNAVFGSDRCFATFLGATRSSHSTTAQLKDFALGSFEQCGASLTTQVSATQIQVGQTVTDSATVHVSGGSTPPAPTGTVTFKLDGAAFDTELLSGAVKVGNDYTVTTSVSYTATTPGHFCFSASWPGDTNYTGGQYADDGTNECFDVADTTSASSAQNWLPNDSGTITSAGGTALNGSLSFTLYSGTTCSGSVLRAAETFTLTGATSPATRTTTNTTTKVLTTQDVSWLVSFTSSDPLVGSSSHCESTSLTITN